MNSCKHCGKEILEGKKFCNSSCAAKYNNARRFRKPWTEEQKQQVKRAGRVDQRYCKYCGKPISLENKEWHVCSECRPYVQKVITYERVGLQEGKLKVREEQLHQMVRNLHEKGHCITEICRELGLHDVTVRTILKEEKVQLYSLSEVQVRMYAEGFRDISPRSEGNYKSGFHITWEGKKVWLRSSYELDYARQLDEQKIRYGVETKRIRYYDTVQQKERVAVPDFYLPDTNEIVEIKSKWTLDEQNMKDKFKAYRDSGYNPILILDKKQIDF